MVVKVQVKMQPPGGAILSTGPHPRVAFSLQRMDSHSREGEPEQDRQKRGSMILQSQPRALAIPVCMTESSVHS